MSALATLDAYVFFRHLYPQQALRLTLLATLYWADSRRQG